MGPGAGPGPQYCGKKIFYTARFGANLHVVETMRKNLPKVEYMSFIANVTDEIQSNENKVIR